MPIHSPLGSYAYVWSTSGLSVNVSALQGTTWKVHQEGFLIKYFIRNELLSKTLSPRRDLPPLETTSYMFTIKYFIRNERKTLFLIINSVIWHNIYSNAWCDYFIHYCLHDIILTFEYTKQTSKCQDSITVRLTGGPKRHITRHKHWQGLFGYPLQLSIK